MPGPGRSHRGTFVTKAVVNGEGHRASVCCLLPEAGAGGAGGAGDLPGNLHFS